jgi:hypothetical protein
LDESLVFQVPEVERLLTRIAQIAFRHDPKGADRREGPRFGSVQRVVAIAVVDQLALRPARQVHVTHEHVPRINAADVLLSVAWFTVALLAPIVATVPNVLVTVVSGYRRTGATPERQPLVLAIVNAIVSLARVDIARIEIARHCTHLVGWRSATRSLPAIRLSEVATRAAIRDRTVSVCIGR